MRSLVRHDLCLVILLICSGFRSGDAFSEQAKLNKGSERRVLAVLDPIDLQTQKIDPEWGVFLRKSFSNNVQWKVIPFDTVLAKFKDYKINPRIPCHEFQCAFDAGNILSAEFVLFGSMTVINDLYAFTLNLVHIPTSQTVWSRVGEIRKRQMGPPSSAMEVAFAQIAADLGPDQVRTGRRDKRGLLTVLDLSAGGSTSSRVMAERVATHLLASRNYDIMGRKEMEELLAALEIKKSGFIPTDSAIFRLGGKMDVTHLVYSRLLSIKGGSQQLQLALYDITAQKKVREWPSQATVEFRTLLEFEDKFFRSLFKLPEYDSGPSLVKKRGAWTWAGVGLGLAAGAAFGYLSMVASQDADKEFSRFQAARSREIAETQQARVIEKERSSLMYGVLGGVGLAGAGGFLVLAF